jgi:hypothetical protein
VALFSLTQVLGRRTSFSAPGFALPTKSMAGNPEN